MRYTEIPEALDRAWHIVDPTFDLAPGETLAVPATAGLQPFTVKACEGGLSDETGHAVARAVDGATYAVLVRADLGDATRFPAADQDAASGRVTHLAA